MNKPYKINYINSNKITDKQKSFYGGALLAVALAFLVAMFIKKIFINKRKVTIIPIERSRSRSRSRSKSNRNMDARLASIYQNESECTGCKKPSKKHKNSYCASLRNPSTVTGY
jgi:hypothetical protein